MSRELLDHKVCSSVDVHVIAMFVHDCTLLGYEPLPNQCERHFGSLVVTMGKFSEEGVEDEGKKSGVSGIDIKAVGSDVVGEDGGEGGGHEDLSGGEEGEEKTNTGGGDVEEPEPKPEPEPEPVKKVTRARAAKKTSV